jgi:hypothetical protein
MTSSHVDSAASPSRALGPQQYAYLHGQEQIFLSSPHASDPAGDNTWTSIMLMGR